MAKKSRFLQADHTEKIHTSPRQEGTFLYFTGRYDSSTTVGKGEPLCLSNEDGASGKSISGSFLENVFIKDGYIFWENAKKGDEISLEIVLPPNIPYPISTNDGNAALVGDTITYITDSQSKDSTWVGTHLLFPIEVVLFRFVNSMSLIGTNTNGLVLESPDVAEIDKLLEFKLFFTSETNNPNLYLSVLMEMYRSKTI